MSEKVLVRFANGYEGEMNKDVADTLSSRGVITILGASRPCTTEVPAVEESYTPDFSEKPVSVKTRNK